MAVWLGGGRAGSPIEERMPARRQKQSKSREVVVAAEVKARVRRGLREAPCRWRLAQRLVPLVAISEAQSGECGVAGRRRDMWDLVDRWPPERWPRLLVL